MADGRRTVPGAPRRGRGTLEHDVLAALSAAGPMSPADVREAVDPSLAYTTVMTALVRLHGKGLVDRERVGRAFVYTAVDDPAELSARAMRRALDDGPDRRAVLRQFVGDLDPQEVPVLQELLARALDEQEQENEQERERDGR
jgi:predicted transcriptional regulator